MSRRANGEGSISKRADGRWHARWHDPDGNRRSAYAKTKAEAKRLLREALTRIDAGEPTTQSGDRFRVVGDRWCQTVMVRQGIAASSQRTYASVLRLHVYPVIGQVRMRDLKPSHVADVLGRMAEAGLSASYRHVAHKAMSGVFEMAVDDGLIRANPVRKVKAPRPGHSDKVVPTREQTKAMIECSPDSRTRALIVVLAYTGLRIGEALSLRWSDWDGAGTLRVEQAKGGRRRSVPVTPTLAEELKAWRKVQTAERVASVWWDEEGDFILSTPTGTQWDPSNARKAFRPVAAEACPGATPHSMRHAAATLMLEEGLPMKVASELLGHRDTRTTADIYSHVTARLLADAGAAIERALG